LKREVLNEMLYTITGKTYICTLLILFGSLFAKVGISSLMSIKKRQQIHTS